VRSCSPTLARSLASHDATTGRVELSFLLSTLFIPAVLHSQKNRLSFFSFFEAAASPPQSPTTSSMAGKKKKKKNQALVVDSFLKYIAR
jgi:hypothetical protein